MATSISDDDLCSRCQHCTQPADGAATCAKDWPGRANADGYIVRCVNFSRRVIVATLRRMPLEVPAPRNGRPGYRWAQGYVVQVGDGPEMFPPVLRREAYRVARAAGATSINIID
jgi:hypothetical protein